MLEGSRMLLLVVNERPTPCSGARLFVIEVFIGFSELNQLSKLTNDLLINFRENFS
jgi:hypothetical protein